MTDDERSTCALRAFIVSRTAIYQLPFLVRYSTGGEIAAAFKTLLSNANLEHIDTALGVNVENSYAVKL